MSPEPNDAKSIFLDAIEKYALDQWPAYLKQTCGHDSALLEHVEALLRAHGESNRMLDGDGLVATIDTAPIAEQPGTQIGRYKLVHEIGHGGMGVVYMAVQKEPVKRKVALKIIKPGMDTREVVTRFEAERQALALMDHQNIATVLDGGSTESGRPFFVMELVEGTPITEYCDACRYTTRQRLELFTQVCQAVQHAHQKGVIHRDIKPSNILVTTNDDKAVPKVIDFGIAKAVHQQLTDASLHTNVAQMIGTPLYMSPEQAQRTGHDVDTRTDVYSLGVLLYELLTGTTPFDKERLQTSGLDEFKRIIREEEPPKPSTRLSTVDAALETVAEKHQTDLRTLKGELSGELDWIVMKALEKDRTRRYESAIDFAKDVQRHLNDETVEACPPSTTYLLGKFARRHKTPLTAAAALLLTLLAGVGGTSWQAVRATQAREAAEEEKDRANTAAANEEEQRKEAERQKQIAQENFQRARNAVDEYLTRVSEDQLLNEPGMQPLRKDLLELALKYYQQFIAERSDDPILQAELAAAYFRVGGITQDIGDPKAAIIAYEDSLNIAERVVADQPDDVELRSHMAKCHEQIGRRLDYGGKPAEGIDHLEAAIDIWEQLHAVQPDNPEYEAGLANAARWLGWVHKRNGNREQATSSYQRAIGIGERLRVEHGDIPAYLADLAGSYMGISGVLPPGDALNYLLKSEKVLQRLADEGEAVNQLCVVYTRMGGVLNKLGRHDDALRSHKKALEIISAVATQNPDVTNHQFLLGGMHNNYGNSLSQRGDHSAAIVNFMKAIEIQQTLTEKHPTETQYRKCFAISCNNLGWLLATHSDPERRDPKRALLMAKKSVDLLPNVSGYWGTLGVAHYRMGNWAESIESIAKALSLEERPTFDVFFRAMAHWQLGEKEEALRWYRTAVEWLEDESNNPNPNAARFRLEAEELMGINRTLPPAGEPPDREEQEAKEGTG